MKKLLLTGFALVTMLVQAQTPTWTAQNANVGVNSFISKMKVVDANVAWAMVRGGAGSNLQNFTKTSNGGTTWTGGTFNLGNTSLLISDITAVDANTAWVCATPTSGGTGGGIWKTTNGGSNWTKQATASYSNATSFADVVYFWDANTGVTLGDPETVTTKFEIYTTTNGGANWTRVPAANIPAPVSGEGAYTSLAWVAGDNIWCGTSTGRILKSNNKGLNWTVVSTPLADFSSSASSGVIALKDANSAWLMDNSGSLYETTDGGANFIPMSPTGTVFYGEIAYVPGTANTLISANQGSSISTDGGQNWTTIETTDTKSFIGAFSPSVIYGGGIWTTTTPVGMYKLSPLLATSNTSLKGAVSVYPNPTKGEVNIGAKSSVKSILLVDMSGKIVKTFENIKKVDLSGLQKGVYMLNVTLVDGQKTSTKLIKE